MSNMYKTWIACGIALIFGAGVLAATVPVETKMFPTVLTASEDQKKPAEPGSKPAGEEEEGGCKC